VIATRSKLRLSMLIALVGVAALAAIIAVWTLSSLGPRARLGVSLSSPRTVATIPADPRRYTDPVLYTISWVDHETLLVSYDTSSNEYAAYGLFDSALFGGAATVNTRSGVATAVLTPHLLGRRLHRRRGALTRDSSGKPASLPVPPIEIGSQGAISYPLAVACPANGLIAYVATRVRRPPQHSLWTCRADGSHARQLTPWQADFPRELTWSPDGRWIVSVARPPTGDARVRVCRADGSHARVLVRAWPEDVTVSPDSRYVAYRETNSWTGEITAKVIGMSGGRPRSLGETSCEPQWLGRSVLFAQWRSARQIRLQRRWPPFVVKRDIVQRAVLVDPGTGQRTRIRGVPDRYGTYWLVTSPADSRLFAAPSGSPPCFVCALTGRRATCTELTAWATPACFSPDGRRLAHLDGDEINVTEVSAKASPWP
jgi:hypothetical protein